jgi:hypothetical protein
MSTTVTMYAPAGTFATVQLGPPYGNVTLAADGSVVVDSSQVATLLKAGFRFLTGSSDIAFFGLPGSNASDVTSIVAAVLPVSGTAFTIALQPAYACKLQVKNTQSGAVAGLNVVLVGTDGRGNTITETLAVNGASTATFTTANAYAKITSITPVGTVTNVTTIGVGQSNALALPLSPTFTDLVVFKETLSTGLATGDLSTPVDETVGTVDTVAGTWIPSSAPNGTTKSYYVYYTWNSAT